MGVTQKDIARRLGLSQSTVAKVLIDSPTIRVTEENRKRILDTARELNYRPNRSAVALRFGKFNAVTLIYAHLLPPGTRSGNSTAIEVFASKLGQIGHELKLLVYSDNASVLERLTHLKAFRDTDAVVLAGEEEVVEQQAILLEGTDIPFFVKGRFESDHPDWYQVDFDHEDMMLQSVEYLKNLGRNRLAYVGHLDIGRYPQRLLAGYVSAAQHFECFTSDEFISLESFYDMDKVQHTVEKWLSLPLNEQPDGVVICGGYNYWHAVEHALLKQNRRIGPGPGELAAVGTITGEVPLLFGNGVGYTNLLADSLLLEMYERQLVPFLRNKPMDGPIIRVRPQLQQLHSLDLLKNLKI